ncbi:hypothetical protein ACHQM5_012858 [Ranunculus cassubicifolius]
MKKVIAAVLISNCQKLPRGTIHSILVHTRSVSSSSRIDPLERLNHRDWLAPKQVLDIFETLRDPNSVMDVLEKYSRRKDYNPNEAMYTLIVQKLSRAKKFDAIQDVMKRVKTDNVARLSDDFFYVVIKKHGEAGYIDRAIKILFSMTEYHCWPTIKTFNYVLNLLVTSKQFDIIHEVYLGASRLGLEIDTCCVNILIKGLCESDKMDAAFALLDEFPKLQCEPNVRTYSTLINYLCKGGRVDEAFKLLEKMEQVGVDPDTITFNMLISGLCKVGKVEQGVALLDNMRFKGCEPNGGSYQMALYGLLDSKKFVEAKCLMDKMVSLGVVPSFESYKLVLHGLCDESLLEDAHLILKEMLRHGFVPRMGMWRKILRSMFSEKHHMSSMQCKFSELAGIV